MKAYLTKRYRFPASHRLHCDELGESENQAIYGKCNHPHGHGHNYVLAVTLSGYVDERTGMVCDLGELDSFVQREILEHFDHANLNELAAFRSTVPTTENLCLEIDRILRAGFRSAAIEKVRIEETRKNSFECGNVRP